MVQQITFSLSPFRAVFIFVSMSAIPTQQKALFLVAKQGDLKVDDTPVLKPGVGEVLIRIEAAGVNPFDWKIKDYGVVVTEFPAILGCESSGTVIEVGEGVTNVAVGDHVYVI